MFNKAKPEDPVPLTSTALEQYLEFTRSPTRNEDIRRKDFKTLIEMPGLRKIVCVDGLSIIETETITARETKAGPEYEIGSFLIFLERKWVRRQLIVGMRFYNQDHIIDNAHHPHISSHDECPYELDTGGMCLQRGQHGVYQWIREGRIPEVVTQLLDILRLHEIRRGSVFKELDRWPKVRRFK